ncbi:MAG: isocitrate/isopropylmalate dehydrogenase family protein [Pseudomonadota bacterium]
MTEPPLYRIATLPGDGIGPEVMAPAVAVLRAAVEACGGFGLEFITLNAGATHYQETGESFSDESLDVARACDAIFLGAMGLPDIRYADGTEIAPQLELREKLNLYAGVRPIRTIKGLPVALADPRGRELDFVLVRESTEGLFKSRNSGAVENDQIARDTMEITRTTSERLFDFAFKLARQRKEQGGAGIVTCVDKANVLGSFAFFRKIFDERAERFLDIEAQHGYVDAVGLWMVKQPWVFDVLVTENMFGDILSDVGAGLMGGMGFAPSADIGDEHAVFQPCHGSAPDIMGKGIANPIATFLSGAMMLERLGHEHGVQACARASRMVKRAVDTAFAGGKLIPYELGGSAGTSEITEAVMAAMDRAAD